MKKGFTIIELMATVIVVAVGVLGTYTVVQRIFVLTTASSFRLTAAYLAQEGIEIVRNIRDTNWVEDDPWNDGLAIGNYEADYNDTSLTAHSARNLKINNNLYNYDSGTETIYKRRIEIANNGANSLIVSVEISWTQAGSNYNLTVEEEIYDWK